MPFIGPNSRNKLNVVDMLAVGVEIPRMETSLQKNKKTELSLQESQA